MLSKSRSMDERSVTSESGGAGYDHDNFLMAQKEPFLRQLLETQMFASFEEECLPIPGQKKGAEVIFFEESILAKKNRSALSYKAFTPFLSDTSNDILETYTAPEPSNWDLPGVLKTAPENHQEKHQESSYSYQQFPMLNPLLYGPIRPARMLLQKPEKGRQANANQNLTLVQDKITQSLESCANSPRNSQKIQSDIERVEIMIRNRMVIAKKRNFGALNALVKVQSRIRMLGPRRIYLDRIAERAIRIHDSMLLALRIVRVQSYLRMAITRKKFLSYRSAVMVLQSCSRRRGLRKVYLNIRNATIKIQAKMRGWIVHKYEKYKRIWIKKCLREDIALLWSKEKAALMYRSKFYFMIQGDSYLHLALYEEEKERLIVSLGGRYTHSTLGSFPLPVEIPLGNSGLLSVCSSPTDNPLIINQPHSVTSSTKKSLNEGLLFAIGVPYKLTQTVEKRLSANELKVVEERKEIYQKLKANDSDKVRDSVFKLFDFQSTMKKKKRTLSASVWNSIDDKHVMNSSQVVLALASSSSSTGGRGVLGFMRKKSETNSGIDTDLLLDAKIQRRVHQACIESVRACMISLQKKRDKELLEFSEKRIRGQSDTQTKPKRRESTTSSLDTGRP